METTNSVLELFKATELFHRRYTWPQHTPTVWLVFNPRGNFHTRNGWFVHSLSEIRNVLEFQNWSQVSHFIVKGLVWVFYWPGKSWWFFDMLKFHSNFLLPNIECLEHFIAEWNQCFSRISLYRFYWACHFRSARDLSWHCSPLYELLTWNCWRTWIATNCWLGMWPCYIRYMRMPPYFVAIECYKRRKTLINTWAPSL